jgi:aminopeptidase N
MVDPAVKGCCFQILTLMIEETMKSISLCAAVLLLLSALCAAQRLPETAVPDNYALTFAPDFNKDNFTGDETIHVRVLKPTSEIVLNAVQIDFEDVSISSGGVSQKATVTPDKEKEIVTLAVARTLQPGPATIRIKYTGILNREMRGFYLGKDDDGRKYASTQFEATDARRAYPSFDEPAYKATFDISVIADKGLTAISNNKVLSDRAGPGDGKHTVKFATTAKMSSYLVALVVGNFEYVEGSADGIPIRVYATPGKKQLGSFSLEAAENIMRYYNHYFGIKYPYGKLDLVAIPDFSAGAMENTGCITFREVILLVDDHAAVDLKKEIASVIAHEMAHQWFGDLVTMQWWDDVWLNEGFATWMSSKPIEAWKPEWNVQLDDVREGERSLDADSLANTRPIHQAADTPAEILESFDEIAYSKAATVLHMVEAYLGPDTFRAGVNEYLQRHAYGNATAADFWNAQTKVSKKPVDKIMATFVQQAGAPIISVKTQCEGNSTLVALAQQRYFFGRGLFGAGSKEVWEIPLCMKAGGEKGAAKCELLTQKQQSFGLTGCAAWVMANSGATGYYRSSYTPEAIRAMAKEIETAFTPAERIVLLSDEWAMVRVGQQPIGDYLVLAEGLQADRNRAVLDQLLDRLHYIGDRVVNESDQPAYQAWVRGLLVPIAKDLGWQDKPGDSDEQKSLRAQLMLTLGRTGRDPETLAQARKITDQVLQDPGSVDRELAFPALQVAAFNGDAALYDRILASLKNAKTPEEYYDFQQALAEFSDPKLLERTLQYAISPDVRSQDALQLIGRVARNPAGERLAWNFVRSQWSDIQKVGGPFASLEVAYSVGDFCDAGLRDGVKDFFSEHTTGAGERTLKQSLERINYCIDLKSQQSEKLAAWLGRQGSSAGN